MNSEEHLDSEAMFDLIDGHSVSRHIEECSDCCRQLEEWRQLHALLLNSQLEDAPPALLKAAHGIMSAPSGMGDLFASVIFDSFAQPVFAGSRGAGNARQLVLRAAEFDIHVKISGKPESRQVSGQILARGRGGKSGDAGFVESARVHLLHNGNRINTARLDPLGEFEFEDSPEGLLSLQIDLPNLTVIGALGDEEVA